MEIIEYKGRDYPKLQSEGFASQYAFAFAKKLCIGDGLDIGFCKPEWKLPGAIGIDEGTHCSINGEQIGSTCNAFTIPYVELDYIFSSHCLEHLSNYVLALEVWHRKLRPGGTLFLYLPNMDYQQYWQPENNRKHLHYLNPMIMQSYFNNCTKMWKNVFVTHGYDLNGSFYAIGEKI